MNADPKRKTHKGDYDCAKEARRHQEEALDDALKNTFPASDPVSIEHRPRPPPTTTDKGLTEAFRSQRSEQLQQEECKCFERSQTSWSAYSNASNRLSTELARSTLARAGSAIPLKGGMTGYLVWLGKNNPAAYATLLARVLPLQVNQRVEHAPKVIYTTVEEARAALIARRIDPDVLERAMMPPFPLPKPLPRPGSAQ